MLLDISIPIYVVGSVITGMVVGATLGSWGGGRHYKDCFSEISMLLAGAGVMLVSAALWPITIVCCLGVVWWRR